MSPTTPTLSLPVTFVLLTLITTALGILAYFSWFDYKKIPLFFGKLFQKGPINHQKWANTKVGEWYLKLFSLFGLLLMVVVIVRGMQPLPTQTVQKLPSATSKLLPDYSHITSNWTMHTIATEKDFSFKLPANWNDLNFWNPMPPNAYGVQSPTFNSHKGFGQISTGSIVDVVVQSIYSDSIDQAAQRQGDEDSILVNHFKVAGYDAIEYSHQCCESHNNVEGILFFRNGKQYMIEQHYPIYERNPYPNIIQQIASTIVFK